VWWCSYFNQVVSYDVVIITITIIIGFIFFLAAE